MKRSIKLLRFLTWSILASASGLAVICASAFLYLSPSLPSVETLKDVHLQTPLRIYTRDEKLIAEFGEKRREPIRFDAVPKNLVHAFMAAEDDRFYSHPGVDLVGLMRAFFQLVSTGRIQSGGSTITMQVAKNFFLSHERVFSRKFNEILLALQIEQELPKDDIFELYLNKIYLGNRAYGIEAAAQVYYNKSVNELNLSQMAMLAGLPKAPSRYNPINDPDRALSRRDWILGRMKELNYISEAQYDRAIAQPVTASYHGTDIDLHAPYVAEMVRQEMIERFGPEAYTEGFKVYTTVTSKLQTTANTSVINGMMAYNERHGYAGPVSNLINDGKTTESEWLQVINETSNASVLYPAVVTEVQDKSVSLLLKEGKRSYINWDNLKWAKKFINVNAFGYPPKKADDILAKGDLIWVRKMPDGQYRLSQGAMAQSALVSMNPEDGAILALVGGFNFYKNMYNRATQATRQAGSTFKPFVYAAAMANGMTAATIINDAPIVYNDDALEGMWRPENDNNQFNGPMRLREGLYRSRNLVSIRVLRDTGINNTINYLEKLGFSKDSMDPNLSLALGNVSISPMELAQGYAVIANGGYKVSPYLIDRVEVMGDVVYQAEPITVLRNNKVKDSSSEPKPKELPLVASIEKAPMLVNELEDRPKATLLPEAERVMEPKLNYIVNDMLNDVIWKGTGRRARELKRHDLGGKTGTTNDSKDVWFVGFNPDILTTVWVGMDDYSTLGRWEFGANAALPIWLEFMKTALKDKPEQHLPRPDGLVTLKINAKTGKLAQQGDTDTLFEIFRREYAPKSTSTNEPPHEQIEESFSPKDLF